MSDQSTPSSSPSLGEHGFRQRLNNLLQSHRCVDKLTSHTWGGMSKGRPIWFARYTCPFHFSPRLLDAYLQPTVDGRVHGQSRGLETAKKAREEAARNVYRQLLWEEVKPVIQHRLNKSGS